MVEIDVGTERGTPSEAVIVKFEDQVERQMKKAGGCPLRERFVVIDKNLFEWQLHLRRLGGDLARRRLGAGFRSPLLFESFGLYARDFGSHILGEEVIDLFDV